MFSIWWCSGNEYGPYFGSSTIRIGMCSALSPKFRWNILAKQHENPGHTHTFIHTLSHARCQVSQINNGKFLPRTKKTHTHTLTGYYKVTRSHPSFACMTKCIASCKNVVTTFAAHFHRITGCASCVCATNKCESCLRLPKLLFDLPGNLYGCVCKCVAMFRHTACGVIVSPLIRCRSAKTSVHTIQLKKDKV